MKKNRGRALYLHFRRFYWLYIFMIPALVSMWFFKFRTFYGLQIAFKDFSIVKGIEGSPWVGFKHFVNLFKSVNFLRILKNSLLTSIWGLVWSFPAPIILALLLNEVKSTKFKRTVQTIIYMPHFLSVVIVVTLVSALLSQSNGVFNTWIVALGGEKIPFLTSAKWFRTVLIGSGIWQGAGWGTIVYLSALSGVPQELYDAAYVDGANRWQRMRHITFPCIAGTVSIMLIMKMGDLLENNYQKILLLMNSPNKEVAEVLETYSYMIGIQQGNYSFASAVGLFQSVVGAVLIFVSNYLAKRAGGKGLW